MNNETFQRLTNEFERLEKVYAPWNSEFGRRLFVAAFESCLSVLGFTYDRFQLALEEYLASRERAMEYAAS